MRAQRTKYGFTYGPADVKALFQDAMDGWVVIGVDTEKTRLRIEVAEDGEIRVLEFDRESGEEKK